jgi:3-isopropylmalate dehydrogenase
MLGSARRVLEAAAPDIEFHDALIGGAALDAWKEANPQEEIERGDPLPLTTRRAVKASNAVLLGPVGGEKWETDDPRDPKPETAVRTLQKTLNVHAFLQPVRFFNGLPDISPLDDGRDENVDFVIVHTLGGVYDGPKGQRGETVYDVSEYSPSQIERLGRTGFELARMRSGELRPPRLASFDKANVMEVSKEWQEVMNRLHSEEYPDVELKHMLVDSAQMELIKNPGQFDVIVSENMFGNISSGVAAKLINSALVPSGWINDKGRGIYTPRVMPEPEGMQHVVNPIPVILAGAMALEYSLDMPDEAGRIRWAINETFKQGLRTPDLGGDTSAEQITDAIVENLSAVTA